MDIKIEIKEETCLPDVSSQNERIIFSKDLVNNLESETVTSDNEFDIHSQTKTEEAAVVSNFSSQNESEFLSEDPLMRPNRSSEDSEIQTKIEIKEEQCWLERTPTETVYICDNIKDETDEKFSFTKSPSLYKEGVSSKESGLFFNEDLGKDMVSNMRKDNLKLQISRKCKIQESDVKYTSSIETSVLSEKPYGGRIHRENSCVMQNHLVQQHNTDKQHKTMEKFPYSSFSERDNLSHEYIEGYKCDICKKCFTHMRDMKIHKRIHENKKTHVCDYCDKSFNNLSKLKTHRLIHEGIRPHKCDSCGKAFIYLKHLKAHKFIHEGTKPHKCDTCDKAFSSVSYLKTHKLIHEGIMAHKCDNCEKAFTNISNLKKHKLIHTGIKPHKCNNCGKMFVQLSHLKAHKYIHEGIKPHKCDSCDKAFAKDSNLKIHKLIHAGIKPHKCNNCGKTFVQLSHLKKHKYIHEGIKPYKCETCDKAFTCLSYLKKHKFIHEGKGP